MRHIVALSGGKDSTALALHLAEVEPQDYEYVCTPTGDELPEMVEHWLRLGSLLGQKIIPITNNGDTLESIITRENILPNWRMRFCTRLLKIKPFEDYVKAASPCTVYVGIRFDEAERDGVDYESLSSGIKRRFPLVEWQWEEEDVWSYLKSRGVTIPQRTDCAACFFQTLWEWYQLWINHPDRFHRIMEWEEQTGHTLRSAQRDSWPAGLKHLDSLFSRGIIPREKKTMRDRQSMCSVCAR